MIIKTQKIMYFLVAVCWYAGSYFCGIMCHMRKRTDRIIKKIYIAVFLICLLLTGCAKKEKADDGEEKADSTTIVLSKGMAEDELFRIENYFIAKTSFPLCK